MIGADPSRPVYGWRKAIIRIWGRISSRIDLFLISFIWISHKNIDVDYTAWLGPNYKAQVKGTKPPIIISNHISWSVSLIPNLFYQDILVSMTTEEFPAFLSAIHNKYVPMVGRIAEALGTVFVDRANATSRSNAVYFVVIIMQLEAIKERVEKFKADPTYPQLWIYPEGTTSNGKHLLRFKRGAFETGDIIQPIFIEYYSPFCSVSFDSVPTVLHFFLMACQPFSLITIYRLPPICPTEYMLENYKNFGQSPPDIYAEVARDIFAQRFGAKKSNLTLVDKEHLLEYLYDFRKTKLD